MTKPQAHLENGSGNTRLAQSVLGAMADHAFEAFRVGYGSGDVCCEFGISELVRGSLWFSICRSMVARFIGSAVCFS
jgi:hypothetical protein